MSKIQGRLITDHLATVANATLPEKIKTVDNINCLASFHSTQAMMAYGNKTDMHRPYLYLTGHVTKLTGDFPCNINELTLGDENTMENLGPNVSYQLEFSQDELAALCQKGLFTSNFECPDIFINNDFVMPLNCSCNYLEPEDENDVPLLFVDIKNQHNIQMAAADTGYNLADYFDDVSQLDDDKSYDYDELQVYNDKDDKLLFNDKVKNESVTEMHEPAVDEPAANEPAVLTNEDKQLQSHFVNVQKDVETKLSKPVNEDDNKTESVTEPVKDNDGAEPVKDSNDVKQVENKTRNVPSHLSDIEKADDELYADDEEEFI